MEEKKTVSSIRCQTEKFFFMRCTNWEFTFYLMQISGKFNLKPDLNLFETTEFQLKPTFSFQVETHTKILTVICHQM